MAGSSRDDERWMRRAVRLAYQGDPSPNPRVGAVVVRKGELVGEGYHLRAGTPHAEVNALAAAGKAARGATLYVTLEPCNHHGRTPPCTEAVIAAGVRRVVVASAATVLEVTAAVASTVATFATAGASPPPPPQAASAAARVRLKANLASAPPELEN